MLTNEQNYILSLIRKSMGQADGPLSDAPIVAAEIKRIVLHGGILLTVYPLLPETLQADLKNGYLAALNPFCKTMKGNEYCRV